MYAVKMQKNVDLLFSFRVEGFVCVGVGFFRHSRKTSTKRQIAQIKVGPLGTATSGPKSQRCFDGVKKVKF